MVQRLNGSLLVGLEYDLHIIHPQRHTICFTSMKVSTNFQYGNVYMLWCANDVTNFNHFVMLVFISPLPITLINFG